MTLAPKIRPPKITAPQVGPIELGANELGANELDTNEIGTNEIGTIELDAIEMGTIEISYGCTRRGIPAGAQFRRWCVAVLRQQARPGGLSLRFVDAAQARALNHQYRAKDYATNVLSFPAPANPAQWLGDLVLCTTVVASEAQEQGKASQAHYAHLTVHGVLHLLGFDHESPAEAEQMEALEVSILAQLGFSDPYASLAVAQSGSG